MEAREVLRHMIRFVLLVLAQVVVFNHMRLGGYINPYVYVLFVLLLPIDVNGWFLLLSAFVLGLTVDMFMDSAGMHAAATVFMAFCRPAVIRLISVKSDFEPGTVPGIASQGLTWVVTYALLLILLHHIPLFFLEVFRLSGFWSTLSRILLSSLASFAFVLLGFFFMGKPARG